MQRKTRPTPEPPAWLERGLCKHYMFSARFPSPSSIIDTFPLPPFHTGLGLPRLPQEKQTQRDSQKKRTQTRRLLKKKLPLWLPEDKRLAPKLRVDRNAPFCADFKAVCGCKRVGMRGKKGQGERGRKEQQLGECGYRSRYLSHAKRTLYHLS